jgi:hypothetical protein
MSICPAHHIVLDLLLRANYQLCALRLITLHYYNLFLLHRPVAVEERFSSRGLLQLSTKGIPDLKHSSVSEMF